jgi:hypothetical protein
MSSNATVVARMVLPRLLQPLACILAWLFLHFLAPLQHRHPHSLTAVPPFTACSLVLQVVVSNDGSDQIIDLKTDLEAGRLLLHWGVEGGRNYKGGWRLPGEECRPEGTQQYKDRALQTPFRCAELVVCSFLQGWYGGVR